MSEQEKQPLTATELMDLIDNQYPHTSVVEGRIGNEFKVIQKTTEGEDSFNVFFYYDQETSEKTSLISFQTSTEEWKYIQLGENSMRNEKIDYDKALEILDIVRMGLEIMQGYKQMTPAERKLFPSKYINRVYSWTHAGENFRLGEGCLEETLKRIRNIQESSSGV